MGFAGKCILKARKYRVTLIPLFQAQEFREGEEEVRVEGFFGPRVRVSRSRG